ncbi:MAG: hypothetical protein A2Z97_00780 [Bdellovibrionales bacterium GWB1_52_6]|nr:MAG: hypothetical protein A2Z97_00780 [Bdellovibrionales bacterium GWB1_52_6]
MYAITAFTRQNDSFFLFGPRGTGKSTWIRSHYASALNLDFKKNTKLCGVYLGKSPLRPDSNSAIEVLDCASFSQALWSGELIQ